MAIASEVKKAGMVHQIFAQSPWTPELILQLRDLTQQFPSEKDAARRCFGGQEGENLGAEEKGLRKAVFHWIFGDYEAAEEQLNRLAGPVRDFVRGEVALSAGKPQAALELLRAVAKKAPQFSHIQIEVAVALMMLGQLEGAWETLAAAEPSLAGFAEYHFYKGLCLEKLGRQEEACDAYQQVLQIQPGHGPAAFRLAFILDLRGEDKKAIELYFQITGDGPLYVSSRVNLALLLEDQNDVEGAIQCLKEALRVAPTNRRAALFLHDAIESLDMYYDENERKENERLDSIMRIPISDFELSVRSRNCLAKMNVKNLGDLVRKTEQELLSYKNFGETSLHEIQNLLDSKGLNLGMFREADSKRNRVFQLRAVVPENSMLSKSISDLALSVRARKCMQRLNLDTIGDLVDKSEADLLSTKNFGHTSLSEVKAKLAEIGLVLKAVD